MRAHTVVGALALALIASCGLEGMFGNTGKSGYPRPASTIRGLAPQSAKPEQLTVIDGDGNEVVPFHRSIVGGAYELRLPSSKYSMIRVMARVGNLEMRALVPFVGPESVVEGVDLDARNMTEALIVEARLAATGGKLQQLTPAAYVGDGSTNGTRTLIRKAFDVAGPTQDLLAMVTRILPREDPLGGAVDPDFFRKPVLDATYAVTTSPLNSDYFLRNPLDYDGVPGTETSSAPFDAMLAQVAQLYDPSGCPDPDHIRLVFSVDFNAGCQDGACNVVNRFLWARDAPGKRMFFVGWVHRDSLYQDADVNSLLGAGVPNTIPMYDDGTNGDDTAGDGIWTVSFDVPSHAPGNPTTHLRLGYKYTWGFFGAPWTGSEEWPGNSRIIEVVDVNGDNFVHRRDVFGDESSNKDNANLYPGSGGSITWTTDLRGCGPEAQEQPSTLHSMCSCNAWITPGSIGPIRVACPAP